MEGCNLET